MVGIKSVFEILCIVLLFSGSILGLISFFMMTGKSSYISIIASYSLIIVGLSLLFGSTLHNIYNARKMNNNLNSKIDWLGKVMVDVIPFFLMTFNLGYLLYLISVNKSIIISGNINNDYNIFSKIFIIVTIIQTSMIFYGVNKSTTGIINPMYNALLVLMSVINFFIIRIIKIVIVNYPVDCISCPLPTQAQPSSAT
jgi:hypothetical protein